MSKPDERPVVIISGNCHARALTSCLQVDPFTRPLFNTLYFRNFSNKAVPISPEDMGRCSILLEQISHQAPELPDKHLLPADCRVIRFPILWMNSLWPTFAVDPRNADPALTPGAPYPFGDRLIMKFLAEGLTPEQAVERYLNEDLNTHLDLDRYHEINAEKSDQLDERADIPFGAWVLENFRDQRLFVSHNHPSAILVRHVRDTVFAKLGLPVPQDDATVAWGALADNQPPVHPSVAEHFGLKWWSRDMLYPHHAGACDIAEYWRRYAAFE